MDWKKEVFQNFKLYAVTDIQSPDPSWPDKIEQAYAGGADIVQLRSKLITDHDFFHLAVKAHTLAERYRKLFFVNDRVDIAIASGADGVHVGQDDIPVAAVQVLRGKLNRPFYLGKSTHNLDQALVAVNEGVDYVGVGPLYGTPTKPGQPPIGLSVIGKIQRSVKIPFVCLGGINLDNITQVLAAGACRVAVVRAIFQAEDVYEATRTLRKTIEESVRITA